MREDSLRLSGPDTAQSGHGNISKWAHKNRSQQSRAGGRRAGNRRRRARPGAQPGAGTGPRGGRGAAPLGQAPAPRAPPASRAPPARLPGPPAAPQTPADSGRPTHSFWLRPAWLLGWKSLTMMPSCRMFSTNFSRCSSRWSNFSAMAPQRTPPRASSRSAASCFRPSPPPLPFPPAAGGGA